MIIQFILFMISCIFMIFNFFITFFIRVVSLPCVSLFSTSGFPLNDQLFRMIIRRYSDEDGNMDFDNYIGCLVRLDAMCRKFKQSTQFFFFFYCIRLN